MKIISKDFRGNIKRLEIAEGQLEKLAQENEKLREIVSRLVECMYGESSHRLTKAMQLDYILGYGYEVEE